jgi:predicted CXXCH cytochrome family protein
MKRPMWGTVMIVGALLCSAVLTAQPAAEEPEDTCVACHVELEDELGQPAKVFQDDLHRELGFSCADCHGGDATSLDMEVSMSPQKGFVGKVTRRGIPELCARCHSDADLIHQFDPQQRVDQLALYRTSGHGRKLAEGDEQVATCTDCHGVHDIRPSSHALSPVHPLRLPQTCAKCHGDEDHMQAYSIPTTQFPEYETSVHWDALSVRGDLSAPSCATCHGNHGAAPPGVNNVAQVCGTCHVVFENAFKGSPHEQAFEDMGLTACSTCHENHAVQAANLELLGVAEGAVCVNCHSEGEDAYAVAEGMKARLDELSVALAEAHEVLDRAEESGMEVSEGRLQWSDANEQLILASVQVHTFRAEPVEEIAAGGLEVAEAARQAGFDALEEREFRRKGLGLSLITIAIVIAGLMLAIRSLDGKTVQSDST